MYTVTIFCSKDIYSPASIYFSDGKYSCIVSVILYRKKGPINNLRRIEDVGVAESRVRSKGVEWEGENEKRPSRRDKQKGRSRRGRIGGGGDGTFNIVLLFCKDVTFSCRFVSFRFVTRNMPFRVTRSEMATLFRVITKSISSLFRETRMWQNSVRNPTLSFLATEIVYILELETTKSCIWQTVTQPLMLLHWLSVWSSNVAWCRILHVLVIYCTLSTYFWMLCEGAYLQLLLVDTFQVGHTVAGHLHRGRCRRHRH